MIEVLLIMFIVALGIILFPEFFGFIIGVLIVAAGLIAAIAFTPFILAIGLVFLIIIGIYKVLF